MHHKHRCSHHSAGASYYTLPCQPRLRAAPVGETQRLVEGLCVANHLLQRLRGRDKSAAGEPQHAHAYTAPALPKNLLKCDTNKSGRLLNESCLLCIAMPPVHFPAAHVRIRHEARPLLASGEVLPATYNAPWPIHPLQPTFQDSSSCGEVITNCSTFSNWCTLRGGKSGAEAHKGAE